MKKTTLLKSMLLLCALVVGSMNSWATDFSTTYSYGQSTWTRTNFSDEGDYYKSSSTTDCVASISGIFTGKTITSNVVITLNVACYGSGSNPTSSKFSVYTSAACTSQVTATQGGTLPSSSTYTNTTYTITQANAASFSDDLAIKVASGTKLIRLKSIKVEFSYTASLTPSSDASFANTTPSLDLKDAATYTQVATTADGYIDAGGSVTYSITENTAGATINAETGEVTPAYAGSVTVQASAAAITGDYLASNATYTLTVTDTRVFTVTCHTGNASNNVDRSSGATLSLDDPSPLYGMSFVGWSSTNNAASPSWVANTTKVTGNMELWAMYEAVAGEYSYHLVEADQADWRGDYLIAYSASVFANGQANGTDGIGSASTVVNPSTSLSGKVVTASWGDDYYVSLEAIDDDDLSKGYLLKTQDDYYNYHTNDTGNGINGTSKTKATAAAYPITVDYVSSSEINLTLDKGQVFRYNTSSKYFRYYRSASYSSQGKVYLYKRATDTAPVYSLGTSLGTEETVTIGSSKYASYCSDKALDFSETDVKAYKAKVDKGKVVLTQVDYVPANTGVVLYCATANNYDVPVIDNAAAVSNNELVGITSEETVTYNPSSGVYNYILQQGTFKKATDGKLRANRAYLSTSYDVTTGSAHELEMVFEGDEGNVTGISELSSKKEFNGEYYNLNGQRVDASHKGIVIVNGKKFFNK